MIRAKAEFWAIRGYLIPDGRFYKISYSVFDRIS